MSTTAEMASDPTTPGATLQQIAADHPELRPVVAGNPSTYPALLDWLGNLGDPSVDLALSQRGLDAEPSPATMASNPQTPAHILHDLALRFPELHPAIAANPATYPALREWIAAQNITVAEPEPEENDPEAPADEEITAIEEVEVTAADEDKTQLSSFAPPAPEAQTADTVIVTAETVAADPTTPAQVLTDIASQRPDLWEVILANPAAHTSLREWILNETAAMDTTRVDGSADDAMATVVLPPAESFVPEFTAVPVDQEAKPPFGLWIAFGVLSVLAVASVAVAVWLLLQ